MPFHVETQAQKLRQRALSASFWFIFAVSLVYLLSLLARLPVESAATSVERYLARHAQVRQLEQQARALEARLRAASSGWTAERVAGADSAFDAGYARLRELAAGACGPSDGPAAGERDAAQARLALAHLGLRASLSSIDLLTPEALDRMHAGLDAMERATLRCLETELTGFVALARQRRDEATVVLVVLGLMAFALLVMRRMDRKRLRDQLHFSEQLIDAIPLPLSLRSPQGNFLLVNREFEQRMGVAREQAIGRPVMEVIAPASSAQEFLDMDARASAATGPVGDTFQVPGPAGPRHVQVRVQAVRSMDGKLMGTVGVQTDLTAMVHKEAQLIEINAKLSQLSMKMIGAQELERRRIARDLHDQVGQILTALKMQLSSLARKPRGQGAEGDFIVPIELAEEALRHTRDLSASLHPHLLDDLGLEPALHWLIDRYIRPSLPQIDLRCQLQPPRGPAAVELVAFRVVQEALTNVVRHAGATRVGVMLETANGELDIEVIDDGVGFEAGATWFDLQRSASVGVTSMRDRVAEVGGHLDLQSSPGNGASLRARLPWGGQPEE